MKYFFLALFWTGYCSLHSYLISIRFTNQMIALLKSYYVFYRLVYVLISIILLVPLISFTLKSDSQIIITYGFTLSIVRYVLISFSLLIFLWSFFIDYDYLSFFGIRQILNFGKIKNANPSKELRKKGLLRIIRHPMYFASIIFLWCQVFTISDVVVDIVLTIYIIVGTKLEEKKLVLEFGEAYLRYQQKVPMLIPFAKRKFR